MFRSTRVYTNSRSPGTPVEELSQAGHKIMNDLHELRNDARTLNADVYDAAHLTADAARYAGKRVRSAAEAVIDAPGSLTHKVRDNPIRSTLIALAVGLIVGKLYPRA